MTAALPLRDYQLECVEATFDALGRHQRAADVLPTGTGKSVIIGGIAERWVAERGSRVLSIAHRDELIRQNANKIRMVAPHLRVGIVKAGEDQTTHPVISASVQTLVSAARRGRIRNVGLVVVDEAHHAPAASYMSVLAHFGAFAEGGAKVVGMTATMIRGDGLSLGDVWQDIAYTKPISWFIPRGYLVRPRGLRVRVPDLNLRGVRKTGGDYGSGSLGSAIEGSMAPELVAKAYHEHATGLQGILFAPTVASAQAYCDALVELGMAAVVVSDKTPIEDRRRALKRFERGEIQILCNAMLFTEGTDLPMAQVCVIGRPTLNKGLLMQMVGRVLRPWPGKDFALILDVSGATERHSLLGGIELFGEQGVEVPVEGEEPELEAPELDELEAPTELDEMLDSREPVWLTGPTEVVEVDLFHGSSSMWHRTYGGVWFISAANTTQRRDEARYIAVLPSAQPGAWDVVEMDAKRVGRSSWVTQGVETLGYAMAFAEANVTRDEQWTARRDSRWRGQPVSVAQRGKARRIGLDLDAEGAHSAGEASNMIEMVLASARIDPYVPAYARARG